MPEPTQRRGQTQPPQPDEQAPPADVRSRVRGSRWGNIAVLAATAALVAGGAWFMDRDTGDRATAGGASAVEVAGADAGPPPTPGQPATGFSALDLSGHEVSLETLRGRPVWVSFVATWCASCRAEAMDVEQAAAAAGEDVEVISVYLNEDATTVGAYAQRLGMSYTQVPDPGAEIAAAYRVMAVPTHVFIDTEGRVVSHHVGIMSRQQMDAALDQARQGAGVAPAG